MTSILERCRGYRVYARNTSLGVVQDVRYDAQDRRPAALAVRADFIGGAVLVVPVSQVAEVSAGERRIVLRSSPVVARDD
ncbi:MAG: PRC-barrel domain-containing protein [Actinomycetota bacterium]|nr:PRC-barrel domain-containing protein [Actinomycetota bacterium]